ncbi:glycosyl transferase family 90 [Aminobacter sp. HY435]|uniref:glycosyl transferase family 90 n=1 Tax=Aminobacter sp. HY435 TaxID=2970917 RepID=UPI0022B978C1|nr:glycosyl transferase family 90 [Aminobacter sp. HY435]
MYMSDIERAARRLHYYFRNIARDGAPQAYFRSRLERLLADFSAAEAPALSRRLNYYNKLTHVRLPDGLASTVAGIPMRSSRYYYDLKEHARYFPRDFRLNHLFGDITLVPDVPAIVKSRPIGDANENSVLMKLDKFRHFRLYRDDIAFGDKLPKAVWRGSDNNPKRTALIERYQGHPLCDVGLNGSDASDRRSRPFLSPVDQMRYRYIISIEGIDVATNLKWVMASNSLCMMPEPVFETWFMEGALEPGSHYVRLRPDCADLEEKILYYEAHQDEARAIVQQANAHVAQFADETRERQLSLLVLAKYFALTGQLAPEAKIAALWQPQK